MLVWTLPSPACMCRATQTRPRSTRAWICSQAPTIGLSAAPEKMPCSGARISVFHDARSVWSWSSSKYVRSLPGGVVVHRVEPVPPLAAHALQQGDRLLDAILEQLGGRDLARIVALAERQVALEKERLERIDEGQLVGQAQLDVDALDALGVLAHPRQRNDDVLVDLERVGVLADRRGALAVEPEFLARFGTDRNEALAGPPVGQPHDLARGLGDPVRIVSADVAEQHHLGKAAPLALGRVADRLEIAVIEVFEAGEDRAAGLGLGKHVVLDVDDRRHRILRVAEELEADGAGVLRHPVHDPARRRDQAVAALFLDAGQTGQELVGDVLAEPFLAEHRARDLEPLGALQRLAAGVEIAELEGRGLDVVDLAEVVVEADDLEPGRLGGHHPPGREVVERGAPQHGLLAARVHRHVAADARRFGRGRVDREHEAGPLGGVGDLLRDDTGLGPHGRDLAVDAGQPNHLDLRHRLELLGVDDGTVPRQRDRTAGVAGAAAARNDGQTEFDAAGDECRHLRFGVGQQHDERILDTPVGGVGHMRDAVQAVEADVVLRGHPAQHLDRASTQIVDRIELFGKRGDRPTGGRKQFADHRVALAGARGCPSLLDLAEAMVQSVDQLATPTRVVEQIVLQIRVALHDPDVAEHFVQHARRTPGLALVAEAIQRVPRARAEQPDHDLAIGEGRVVVGDFAQPRRHRQGFIARCDQTEGKGGVHRRRTRALDP